MISYTIDHIPPNLTWLYWRGTHSCLIATSIIQSDVILQPLSAYKSDIITTEYSVSVIVHVWWNRWTDDPFPLLLSPYEFAEKLLSNYGTNNPALAHNATIGLFESPVWYYHGYPQGRAHSYLYCLLTENKDLLHLRQVLCHFWPTAIISSAKYTVFSHRGHFGPVLNDDCFLAIGAAWASAYEDLSRK